MDQKHRKHPWKEQKPTAKMQLSLWTLLFSPTPRLCISVIPPAAQHHSFEQNFYTGVHVYVWMEIQSVCTHELYPKMMMVTERTELLNIAFGHIWPGPNHPIKSIWVDHRDRSEVIEAFADFCSSSFEKINSKGKFKLKIFSWNSRLRPFMFVIVQEWSRYW